MKAKYKNIIHVLLVPQNIKCVTQHITRTGEDTKILYGWAQEKSSYKTLGGHSCKNRCRNYYPDKRFVNQNWAELGYIKCMTCNFHIKTSDIFCKCCGIRFRRTVRNKHSRQYYREVLKPQIQRDRDIIVRWKQKRQTDLTDKKA